MKRSTYFLTVLASITLSCGEDPSVALQSCSSTVLTRLHPGTDSSKCQTFGENYTKMVEDCLQKKLSSPSPFLCAAHSYCGYANGQIDKRICQMDRVSLAEVCQMNYFRDEHPPLELVCLPQNEPTGIAVTVWKE